MKVIQLQEVSSIVQGTNITRVETTKRSSQATQVKLLTLKQFNESMGLPYRLAQDKKSSIWIEKELKDKLRFTKEDMIVVHLLSQRVVSIPGMYKNLLIPSNFVVINFKQQVDSRFIAWYLNEHVDVKRQFMLATQGSSVSALSISMLREVKVSLPALDLQQKMGNIMQAVQQKNRLMEEKKELEEQYINQLFSIKMEEKK